MDLHTTAIHCQLFKLSPSEEQIWNASRPTLTKKMIQFLFLLPDSVILLRVSEKNCF